MTKLTQTEISQAFTDAKSAKGASSSRSKTEAVASPEFFTRREFIARTGISASTLERYRRDGHVPFWQPSGKGGKVLIPISALARFGESAVAQIAATTELPASGARQAGPAPKWRQDNNPKVQL